MPSSLWTLDLSRAWQQVIALIENPYSNIIQSLLLLAVVVLAVLIVVLTIAAVVAGPGSARREARELDEIRALQYYLAALEAEEAGGGYVAPPHEERTLPAAETASYRLAWLATIVVVLVLLGVAVGLTTSSPAVCAACHRATTHAKAVKAGVADPHLAVTCVACHESSGWLGSITIEVPERFSHYLNGLNQRPGPSQYGDVASSACSRCHSRIQQSTTVDVTSGVRVAHKQPLVAGARCLDCHTSATGVVSSLTVGMTPCLRCHDGKKASAECALCHTKAASAATRATAAGLQGRQLIDTPNCGACHNMAKTCDPCHGGVRMPHSALWRWWGHARKGVEDIWFNGGRACGRCHTADRMPCTKCHAFLPTASHGISWRIEHKRTVAGACDACHGRMAYVAGRSFCGLCHGKVRVNQ